MSKEKILSDNDYIFHPDRNIWFNRVRKKIFSEEVIADHDEEWLSQKNSEDNDEEWEFYFHPPVKKSIKEEIIEEINGTTT